jgi:8-oxo-dGTP pyrophosphatase MutT (NUDIX family)
MTMSQYYRDLRARLGSSLLMMPAVAAVIRDAAGKILMQQRHDESWSLPAGAVEPGETPAQAVSREVFEETGLIVEATAVLGVVGGAACRVRYANDDEVESVVTVFACRAVGGSLVTSNDETKRLAYFSNEALPRLAFEYPKQIFTQSTDRPYFE